MQEAKVQRKQQKVNKGEENVKKRKQMDDVSAVGNQEPVIVPEMTVEDLEHDNNNNNAELDEQGDNDAEPEQTNS